MTAIGVGTSDSVTLIAVMALTLATARLASYLATQQATMIDPTRALKMQ